jgi:hypothetical protein
MTSQTLKQQQSLQCESTGNKSYWGHAYLSRSVSWYVAKHKQLVSVLRATLVTLGVCLDEMVKCRRYTAGLIFIIIGLGSEEFYKIFDPAVRVADWYYQNNYWFFWTIRKQMEYSFLSVGYFLFIPTKFKLRYLIAIVLWDNLSDIVHYSFYVTSFETFHKPMSWTVIVSSVGMAISLIVCADYMCYRKYHLKHGTIARILGIIKAPGVPVEKKISVLENENVQLENLYARI